MDAFGRRFLLLCGAVGMTIGHAVLATIFTVGCHGNTENAGFSKGTGVAMMFFTCLCLKLCDCLGTSAVNLCFRDFTR